MSEIVAHPFPKPRAPRPAPPMRGTMPKVTTANPRRLRRQHLAAGSTGGVAVVLTGLSLSHLAHGIELVTGAAAWECWALAVGVDLGFLAFEVALLCAATEAVRRSVGRWAHPAVMVLLVISGCLNALAFAHAATDWRLAAAAALGLSIPTLVYVLARVSFVLATQGNRAEA